MGDPRNDALVRSSIAYLRRVESEPTASSPPVGTFLSLPAGEGELLPVQLFSHEMAVFYAYDDGSNFTYVTNAMREDSGLSVDELHDLALANLAQRFRDMEMHQGGGMLVLTGDSNFEASMILVDTIWDQLAHHFPNGAVAALPARDMLGLADAQDDSAVAGLRATAQKFWDDDAEHLLARHLYQRQPDRSWVPLP